ncbi:zinc finger protein 879 [Drosophila novamexicana]|uniref:zinc finger protein 879 n=1 Tax=Drosophila novamexicana TaxID=47314 RepID=UPI0011E602BC|nr:zinc finger protein 879 [Drosophila novamexicana]
MELPPRIVYVCSLCLRQYDLLEDLRGHMMLYHKCEPITPTSRQGALPKQNAKNTESQDQNEESLAPPPPAELQPLPFRDFRVVLHANQQLHCDASSACIYKFEDIQKLAMHGKCHKDAGFSCSECGADMPNWRRCSLHLWKVHHLDVDLLQCPALGCDYKSPISALVWRHMRVHRKWRARVMRRELLLRRRAQKQQQQQEEQQQQQQQQRSEATASQASQPQAAATAKKNKYYAEKTCEICQRKFVNGKTLSKHVKTVHNKIKPFICNVCGKKTARKASLIIHMRQHTGEKPLKCEHCKFSTRDPSSLYKHRQRHASPAAAPNPRMESQLG